MKYWKNIFRKKLYKRSRKGFTLIELLVVTAIIGILIGISTTVFIGVLRSQNKTNVTNEVRQNAIHALDLFERDVRSADSVTPIGATDTITANYTQASESVTWVCVKEVGVDGHGFFTRQVGTGPTEIVTNNDKVSGVDIDCIDDVSSTDPFSVSGSADSWIIGLDFTAKQGVDAPTRSDFGVELKFETTVGTRQF
jgi:prepilin-type N-terminal cleavage/methylation domain-containing protein